MSESDHKQQILEKLKLITDEPEIENLEVNFKVVSTDHEFFDKLKKLVAKLENPDNLGIVTYRIDLLPKLVLEILENIVTKDETYRIVRRCTTKKY